LGAVRVWDLLCKAPNPDVFSFFQSRKRSRDGAIVNIHLINTVLGVMEERDGPVG
jgi:hypothetical protein